MKLKTLSLVIAMGLVGSFQFAGAQTSSQQPRQAQREVMIGISDAFIPGGFDSASDAYVVTSGVFPNGCYRWSRAEVSHLPGNVHEVRSFAKVQTGLCIMVLVPFTKEVQLGQLESGTHKVRFISGDDTYLEKQLIVE